jgi:hypothetical protein
MTTDRDFDSTAYGRGYKDGKRDAAAEIARLRERLEIDPSHPYDGIYCRDETIRGQDAEIARLKAEVERTRVREQELADEANRLLDEVKASDKKVFCLTAEVERLRAALEPFVCDCSSNCEWERDEVCPDWNARAALNPSQEPRT